MKARNRILDVDIAKSWCPQGGISANMIERDVNARGDKNSTLLMASADKGNATVAEALIRAGADVNAKNVDNQTALIMAAFKGHAAIVKALVKSPGVDVNAKDVWQNSALILAAEKNERSDVVTALLATPVIDITAKGNAGKTAFVFAMESGKADIVNALNKHSPPRIADVAHETAAAAPVHAGVSVEHEKRPQPIPDSPTLDGSIKTAEFEKF
jgi:ankyrin repeat protein